MRNAAAYVTLGLWIVVVVLLLYAVGVIRL